MSSSAQKLIESLSPLERQILPLIKSNSTLQTLIKSSSLSEVEVMRALQWLQNKKIISLKADVFEMIEIDSNGIDYLKKGLPERRFLQVVSHTPLKLAEIQKKASLNPEELNVCIGLLKKKAAVGIEKGVVSILPQGKKISDKKWLEDEFLKKVAAQKLNLSELSDEERFSFDIFKKRKNIIKTSIEKHWIIQLTKQGKDISCLNISSTNLIEKLTPKILKDSSWKSNDFRRYDIQINVPRINRGKRHFVNQAVDYARRVWTEFGFKEMTGPLLNTSFWNFDALFQPQDHPARDLQDTFFISSPSHGKLLDKRLVEKVKAMHENGGDLDSLGWQYNWSKKEAAKNVLRTHTTVLSAKTLAQLKKDEWPAKYFAVGKCFRNETVDWCHGFEFNQFEGIVVDPDANFKNLLGYLKKFMGKIGFPKARFRPAYFPYTEMSTEIDVFHPVHKKWVELGGAGIFRPEVVVPLLGEDVPVLAWGPGLDRQMMEYYRIKDLRDFHNNNIKQLREIREWML